MLAKVPTAPEMAQVAISRARRDQPLAAARELGVVAGELEAEGGRLGVDAVAAADGQACILCSKARRFSAASSASRSASSRSAAWASCTRQAGVEHVRRGHALVHEARRPARHARRGWSGRR